ncbi:Nif3-like dinuclear metal center hexameric protein [Sutterella sp.]|uniref:Nif3-like dinuclear metal center hexameric protein n=1 Tax=Sutterella sp. TaxID=1981025 RepID=UPI0026DEC6FC|nr:Nif3-like dinuclear metal center hexameric protein [Sutterella sp.]MDO5531287.1 Nif3-like dinuclear metal center hexameric protein [Sutterella sp.]
MKTRDLIAYLDELLVPGEFKDYAPNGLQVEGRGEVNRIVLGVSASLGLIEAARERRADAVLVHHGWFWRGEDARITGVKGRRVRTLIESEMNLIAYHLPLDAHAEVGNNAELARVLGLSIESRTGEYGLLHTGSILSGPMRADAFAARVTEALGRAPLLVGDAGKTVARVGWCSGAAQDWIGEAAALGCDLYLSGEIREHTTFEAVELGIPYLAAGHTATEQFGIQALGRRLSEAFPDLTIEFVPQENPA